MDYQSSGVLEDYQNLALGVETLTRCSNFFTMISNAYETFKFIYDVVFNNTFRKKFFDDVGLLHMHVS
jgi:hypothetical protein